MRRFTVSYSHKDRKSKQVVTREAEGVQWSDGGIYLNGDIVPGEFAGLAQFEGVMGTQYVSYEIRWIDKEEEANV